MRTVRCTNGDFYVALGSSMGLALLVWEGRWSVKAAFILFLVMSLVLGQKFLSCT